MNFCDILMEMKPEAPKMIAVAAAEDKTVLQALCEAYKMGFAEPILCGPVAKIKENAAALNLDISKFQIVDIASPSASASAAVSLVRNGHADILMKGLIQTADMLRAVLHREEGIRGAGVISHISVLYSEARDRTILLTDAAMLTNPDLKTKVEMVKNAVLFANKLGINNPRVAPLAAVEVVNPDMQATIDAAALTQMNRRGQINGCIIDGPLAFDVAVSESAAEKKGLLSDVAGNADILLFHNIDAGNSTLKSMVHFGDFIFGGILMGAKAPIIVNSRSDSEISKLFSIACACLF
jgi:phosphate butyryltransferase